MRKLLILLTVGIILFSFHGCAVFFGYRNYREIYSKADIKYSPDYQANAGSTLRIDGEYLSKDPFSRIIRFWSDGTVECENRFSETWGLYRIDGDTITANYYYRDEFWGMIWERTKYYTANDTTLVHVIEPQSYEREKSTEKVYYHFRQAEIMPESYSPLKHISWLNGK